MQFLVFCYFHPYCLLRLLYKNFSRPDQRSLDGWVLSCKAEGQLFNSWSGHMPRLRVWSPVRVPTRGNQLMFLTLMFLSLFLLLSRKERKRMREREKKKKIFLGHIYLGVESVGLGYVNVQLYMIMSNFVQIGCTRLQSFQHSHLL